ncbi:MAG: hypothetical protein KAT15_22425, partial [Bacteroidales bacterium]|nr:hypothetical protein [Bacteroidales bacterium]
MIRKNPILILFLGVVFIYSGCKKKESSGEFKPFKHTCSIEELKEKYSSELMAQAKSDMEVLDSVNREGAYQGTLESIDLHSTPDWYQDAKLSIFFDW